MLPSHVILHNSFISEAAITNITKCQLYIAMLVFHVSP